MAAPGAVVSGDRRSPTRRVLSNRVFLVSYLAEAQSIFGDQLARVALAVIVFELTGSTPATAATYAATFLPAIAGGFVLGRIGDRVSRRTVMVGCDVVRAGCFGVMALRPDDIVLLVVLLVLAVTLGPAFSAAQLGLLAARLDLDEFTAGNAIRLVTSQAAQVGGFAAGGLIVAALDPTDALAVNAVTFAVSALLLQLLIPSDGKPKRESLTDPATDVAVDASRDRAAFAGLWRDRSARQLVILSLCVGFFVVPEGLAVPVAHSIGADDGQAGLLLASGALGGAIGAAVLVRLGAATRTTWANAMAVLSGLPLVLSALLTLVVTDWWVMAVNWLLSGAFAAYIVHTTSRLIHAIPDALRSRTVGVLSALLLGSQGLAVLAFGGLAAVLNPAAAVGLAGAAGSLVTAVTLSAGRSVRRPGRHAITV